LKCLRGSGNVLICTDTAGRVLELAHLIDQLWKDTGLIAYSAGFLNNVSSSVADFAKSQVEWMNEKIARSFAEDRHNPFNFKYLKLCDSLEDVNKLSSPKLVLASSPDMECGFSRDLFTQWCSDERNLVIFTKRPTINTLARNVVDSQEKSILVQVCFCQFFVVFD
jgi:cleavage and polyadenylation specificity factor subunit 2